MRKKESSLPLHRPQLPSSLPVEQQTSDTQARREMRENSNSYHSLACQKLGNNLGFLLGLCLMPLMPQHLDSHVVVTLAREERERERKK